MIDDKFDIKIRQMHAALEGMASDDLSSVTPQVGMENGFHYVKMDFNQNADEAALANSATLLIANIATMKDHLKVWCKRKCVDFYGDTLINSNREVALIHDLWNIDKHAELSSRSRSGFKPQLQNLRKCLQIQAGNDPNSGSFWQMDTLTGQVTTGTTGSGSIQISITAQVVDDNGNVLGNFTEICTKAVDEWTNVLLAAGVPLP